MLGPLSPPEPPAHVAAAPSASPPFSLVPFLAAPLAVAGARAHDLESAVIGRPSMLLRLPQFRGWRLRNAPTAPR